MLDRRGLLICCGPVLPGGMPRAICGPELLLAPILVEAAKLSTVSIPGVVSYLLRDATLLSLKLFKEALREGCCLYLG